MESKNKGRIAKYEINKPIKFSALFFLGIAFGLCLFSIIIELTKHIITHGGLHWPEKLAYSFYKSATYKFSSTVKLCLFLIFLGLIKIFLDNILTEKTKEFKNLLKIIVFNLSTIIILFFIGKLISVLGNLPFYYPLIIIMSLSLYVYRPTIGYIFAFFILYFLFINFAPFVRKLLIPPKDFPELFSGLIWVSLRDFVYILACTKAFGYFEKRFPSYNKIAT